MELESSAIKIAKKPTAAAAPEAKKREVHISAPKFEEAAIRICGTAPLVMHAFSEKQQRIIEDRQALGDVGKKNKKREPKDFDELYQRARHLSTGGWDGIPAPAFRNAMIAACRTVGFTMTIAKCSIFVLADGYDENGNPLVKITKGKPKQRRDPVLNDSGVVDIRARPMWEAGWEAIVRVRWDADQFSASDVVNLLARAGVQIGLCEGRPFSKNSYGQGWGTFEVIG
jgi:hypothetical protein